MSETLVHDQHRFAALLSVFLVYAVRWAQHKGYQITLRELWRPAATAAHYAETGAGIANSLHCDSLALDLLLRDSDGEPLSDSALYEPLGKYWESLNPDCAWGGRFAPPRVDGGHFSLSRGGRK